jgi:hypothetical protein
VGIGFGGLGGGVSGALVGGGCGWGGCFVCLGGGLFGWGWMAALSLLHSAARPHTSNPARRPLSRGSLFST